MAGKPAGPRGPFTDARLAGKLALPLGAAAGRESATGKIEESQPKSRQRPSWSAKRKIIDKPSEILVIAGTSSPG